MSDFGYCHAWPDELKECSRTRYRALQRVRNLEAYITRVDPDDFHEVMQELEMARGELLAAGITFLKKQRIWDTEHETLYKSKATQA